MKKRRAKDMKKKHIRKYLRRADDCMEQIERKMKCIDSVLLFFSMGMEYFYQKEDCPEVKTVQFIKDYLKTIRTDEITDLHEVLARLKEV